MKSRLNFRTEKGKKSCLTMLATPALKNLNQLGYRVRSFLSKKTNKRE